MAATLRELDGRFAPDTDANKYFVVICTRKSPSTNLPGHAFIVWGKEDAQAHMSSQRAFGFYPKDGNKLEAAFGENVPGDVVNEAFKSSPSLLTGRIIVQVNASLFSSTQQEITKWATADYNLYAHNCISFANAVALDMGLVGVPDNVGQFPADYFQALVSKVETAYGGKWRSSDATHRFSLEITGPSVTWTENSTAGALTKKVSASHSSTPQLMKIERPNTDDVLQFIGFSNPALRAEILAKNPEPSVLSVRRVGDSLQAEWRGLLVTKLANGHLDRIVQPSQGQAKPFTFTH